MEDTPPNPVYFKGRLWPFAWVEEPKSYGTTGEIYQIQGKPLVLIPIDEFSGSTYYEKAMYLRNPTPELFALAKAGTPVPRRALGPHGYEDQPDIKELLTTIFGQQNAEQMMVKLAPDLALMDIIKRGSASRRIAPPTNAL